MAESRSLRVLIVEDEPLGYRRLAEVLEVQSDVDVVGWAKDAPSAVESIRSLGPDLVFLDIHLSRGTGLDVVRTVGVEKMPPIVFVTAYDRYAVEAFRLAAVDYLLKPYTDAMIGEALGRVRRTVATEDLSSVTERLRDLLHLADAEAPPAEPPPREPYLSRIAVESQGRLRIVPVAHIDYIQGQGVYAELHVGADRHLIREPLRSLERRLDPEQFCRIHRSQIVRLDQIHEYIRGGGGYEVRLKSGPTLPVGRLYRKDLELRLGCL